MEQVKATTGVAIGERGGGWFSDRKKEKKRKGNIFGRREVLISRGQKNVFSLTPNPVSGYVPCGGRRDHSSFKHKNASEMYKLILYQGQVEE